MSTVHFSTPVTAHLALVEGGPCIQALRSPHDGLHAIHRQGLGEFRFDRLEVVRAVEKLARAAREPTPELLEGARAALAALASTGAAQRKRRPAFTPSAASQAKSRAS